MTYKTILSCSLKGGTGKTTVAINTARSLLKQGYKVGILDIDYRTPNVPVALDDGVARLSHTYDGDILIPPVIEGIKVFSMAYIWPDWKCVMVDDNQAMDDVLHLFAAGIIDWGELDYLVIDTPPTSVGVVQIALEADSVVGALIVSHASRVSRMDIIRTLDLFAEKEVPIIGIICNQSVGEDGKLRYDLSPSDIEAVAKEYGVQYLGSIPHITDPLVLQKCFDSISEKILATEPVTLHMKEVDDKVWKTLKQLSQRLSGKKSN